MGLKRLTTFISREAFSGSNVRYVWLSENTTGLGDGAFADCPNLKFVYVPWDCQDIGNMVFPAGTAILTVSASEPLAEYMAEHNELRLLELEDPFAGNG